MSKKTEWDMPNFTEEEYKKMFNDLKYQRYYSRWPVVDPKTTNLPLAEYFHLAWTQYAKILDNGKGLDTTLTIQNQINSEIEEIQINLDDFPDDADSVYKYRLKRSQNLLNMRTTVLKKLITAFSVHGEIETTPDFELDDIQKLALTLTCKGKHHPHIKEVLIEYLKRKEADQSKTVIKIFKELETEFDLSYSTFAGWVKELYEQFESIARTGI